MSVDDYEKRFMQYYNKVMEEYNELKPSYDTAEQELLSAKSNAEKYEELYNTAKLEKQSLTDQIATEQNNLLILQQSLSEISKEINEQQSIKEQKEKEYSSLQKKYDQIVLNEETSKHISEISDESNESSSTSTKTSKAESSSTSSIAQESSTVKNDISKITSESIELVSESESTVLEGENGIGDSSATSSNEEQSLQPDNKFGNIVLIVTGIAIVSAVGIFLVIIIRHRHNKK